MRIMHLLSSNKFSGAENVALMINENVSELFDCYYVSPEGDIRSVVEDSGINFYGIKSFTLINIAKAINFIKPDIIHCHDFKASLMGSLYFRKSAIISHIHQNPPWIKSINVRSLIYYASTFLYSKIIFVSSEIQSEIWFGDYLSEKFIVLPNYVDSKKIQNKAGLGEHKYDIAYVGRLNSVKNPLKFLAVIAKIKKIIPSVKAVVVGDGDLLDECVASAKNLNIMNNIEFVGFKRNPYAYIASSSMLLITSHYEGFGLVAVEAMVLGKPVIAPSVGGLKSIVNESVGTLSDDVETICDEILILMSNDEVYREKSIAALQASKKYTNSKEWFDSLCFMYNSSIRNVH